MAMIPKHVAIIMDGNGRWAEKRGLERFRGHFEGMKRVGEIITAADEEGIEVLTLYAFSQQNWKRPETEIKMLMQMISMGLRQKAGDLRARNYRFDFFGKKEGIPQNVLQTFLQLKEMTVFCTGLRINLAFNYGSRTEILEAVRATARKVRDGEVTLDDVTEEFFSSMLYTRDIPDPDLLIRTSGEQRISNFLLWQISYAELYFTKTFWPDFTSEEFRKALKDYAHRERRFGDIQAPETL